MEDSTTNHTTTTETRSPGNRKMMDVSRLCCFDDPPTIVSHPFRLDYDDNTYYENDGYDDQTYADSRYGEYGEGDAYTQDDYTQGQYGDDGYYDEGYYDNQYPDDGTYDQDYHDQGQAADDQWSSNDGDETYDGSNASNYYRSDPAQNARMSAEEREYVGADSDNRSTMEDLD